MKENIDKIEASLAKRFPNLGQINAPYWNEKYEVWVVRAKTGNTWKAVWRSGEDEAKIAHDRLLMIKSRQLAAKPKTDTNQAPKVVAVKEEPKKKEEEKKSADPKYSFNKQADTGDKNKLTSKEPVKKQVTTK